MRTPIASLHLAVRKGFPQFLGLKCRDRHLPALINES